MKLNFALDVLFVKQNDSFNSMVPKIKEADLLVIASPLYYFSVSARIKAFIERIFSIENNIQEINQITIEMHQRKILRF